MTFTIVNFSQMKYTIVFSMFSLKYDTVFFSIIYSEVMNCIKYCSILLVFTSSKYYIKCVSDLISLHVAELYKHY